MLVIYGNKGSKKIIILITNIPMILATLLNLYFSRGCAQGFREILHEKPQKTSFYFIELYVEKMIYLLNNDCIRLSCARHYKMFKDFYKLINFP